MQSEINAFLTAKMELEAQAAGQRDAKEVKEEENYGEADGEDEG